MFNLIKMDFEISDCMKEYDKPTNKGTCKACGKKLVWGREKLASHKRGTYTTVSPEEKELFRRVVPSKSSTENLNLDASMTSLNDNSNNAALQG